MFVVTIIITVIMKHNFTLDNVSIKMQSVQHVCTLWSRGNGMSLHHTTLATITGRITKGLTIILHYQYLIQWNGKTLHQH